MQIPQAGRRQEHTRLALIPLTVIGCLDETLPTGTSRPLHTGVSRHPWIPTTDQQHNVHGRDRFRPIEGPGVNFRRGHCSRGGLTGGPHRPWIILVKGPTNPVLFVVEQEVAAEHRDASGLARLLTDGPQHLLAKVRPPAPNELGLHHAEADHLPYPYDVVNLAHPLEGPSRDTLLSTFHAEAHRYLDLATIRIRPRVVETTTR